MMRTLRRLTNSLPQKQLQNWTKLSNKPQPFQCSGNWPKAANNWSIYSRQLTELRVRRVSLRQCGCLDLLPSHAPHSPHWLWHWGSSFNQGRKDCENQQLHWTFQSGLDWSIHGQSGHSYWKVKGIRTVWTAWGWSPVWGKELGDQSWI